MPVSDIIYKKCDYCSWEPECELRIRIGTYAALRFNHKYRPIGFMGGAKNAFCLGFIKKWWYFWKRIDEK